MDTKRVLIVSYHVVQNDAIRILSTILKTRYDISKLFIMDYGTFELWNIIGDYELFPVKLICDFCRTFDYILISSTSYHTKITYKLCDYIKLKYPKIKIILGGPMVICQPKESLKHADSVCIWEGFTILDLMDYFEGKGQIKKKIANFLVKDKTIKTYYKSVSTFDQVPFPDYSKKNSFFLYKNKIIKNETYNYRNVYLVTSIGCVFNCSFCSTSFFNQIKKKQKLPLVAKSKPKNIIERMEHILKENPETTRMELSDDNFFFYTESELKEFVDLYNTNINLPIRIVADQRSIKFIEKFKLVCRIRQKVTLDLAIQTGSEEFNRQIYNRNQSNKEIIAKHKQMRNIISKDKINIEIRYDIIYANPYEKIEDVIKTINFMLSLRNAEFKIFAYIPLPGTPLGEKFLDKHNYQKPLTSAQANYTTFEKFAFYYFIYFVIRRLNISFWQFLLPPKIKNNNLIRICNNKIFAKLFYNYMQKNIQNETKRYRKSILDSMNIKLD